MTEMQLQQAMLHVDGSIESYISRCRSKIPEFVDSNFTLEQTWKLQKPTFWFDLLLSPVNSAWALPYLSIKKVTEILDKMGVNGAGQFSKTLPSGIKTGYQKKIEAMICREILEWEFTKNKSQLPHGFLEELKKHRLLEKYDFSSDRNLTKCLRKIVEDFSSARALVSDLSGTLLTIAIGWWSFGNTSLSLNSIAYKFAKQDAHEKASSRFFLGKKIGSTFYDFFPPEVSESRVKTITILLGLGITVGAMVCSLLSDPVRKSLGFHRHRLNALLDDLEKELLVFSHKRVRLKLKESN